MPTQAYVGPHRASVPTPGVYRKVLLSVTRNIQPEHASPFGNLELSGSSIVPPYATLLAYACLRVSGGVKEHLLAHTPPFYVCMNEVGVQPAVYTCVCGLGV